MTMHDPNWFPSSLLPDWAAAVLDEPTYEYRPGLCLPTKDGRNTGNAVLFRKMDETYHHKQPAITVTLYCTVTDAGNVVRYTRTELEQLFYPGFIITMDLRKHQRKAIKERFDGWLPEWLPEFK